MERKTLLLNQVENIKKQVEQLYKEKKSLIEENSTNELRPFFTSEGGANNSQDIAYLEKILLIDKEIKDLEDMLKNSIINDNYNENSVEVGTHFMATTDYDGDMLSGEYILVEDRTGYMEDDGVICISTDSPFGKAVKGKKILEPFYYDMDNEMVVGFVEHIIPKEEVKTYQKTR